MVCALIVLAMAALATVAWGRQPARELQTLEQAPIAGESNASSAPEDVAAVCQRARAKAEGRRPEQPRHRLRAAAGRLTLTEGPMDNGTTEPAPYKTLETGARRSARVAFDDATGAPAR
jgi:hypothetical protein